MKLIRSSRQVLILVATVAAAILSGAAGALFGSCGPFTDVSDAGFCPFVLEIFYLGITTGTTPTTYDPTSSVTRLQMAAFLSRTVDGSLRRASRRVALDQFWTPQGPINLGLTTVGAGSGPTLLEYDGADVWVANFLKGTVSRVHGSDGRLLETWTGAPAANGVLVAMGRVFVTGSVSPGNLYRIDPSLPAGSVTTVASNLGNVSNGIAFDGSRIWTADQGASVSIVTPGVSLPWTVTTVATGFVKPVGVLYDGGYVWVTDFNAGTLLQLGSTGAILKTITVGGNPGFPAFDGSNIWVPVGGSNSVSVVRASSGDVLATLTDNPGLNNPLAAAFDGQRVLVTNNTVGANSVSLWRAADLAPLGTISTGGSTQPVGVCSGRANFWISLFSANALARF